MAQMDLSQSRIEAVFSKRGCPAAVRRGNRGYTIVYNDQAVSRVRQRGRCWEVLWWSHRDKWESIGDLGGMVFDTIEEAAGYVLDDPMGIFWQGCVEDDLIIPPPVQRAAESKVPAKVRPTYDTIVSLTDSFCHEHLNDEYAELCRRLAGVLSRKRRTPITSGKVESWACGIVRTIGWVNFLGDPSQTPHMKIEAVNAAFGVSSATAAAKLKTIRESLNLIPMHPDWTLPSRLEDNPLAWMIEVDGLPMDARALPREIQEEAFRLGLIPYVPNDEEGGPGGTP